MAYGMNPQRARHMGQEHAGSKAGETHEDAEHGSGGHHPHIHIHSHSKGHTVHIMHHDGTHEKHEHEAGDADGIASHIHEHIGGEDGQDHGYSSGEEMEDEHGFGPGV